MFETKITRMLGIKYPIIGGTMMSITSADFAAAISDAGGLGVLCSIMYQTKDAFASAIDRIRELTDQPFGVNLNFFPAQFPVSQEEYTEIMIEKGVKIVETSGHRAPEELSGRFKEAGLTWIHKCAGARYARKAEKLGADIVTVVGYENGGATGKYDIGTLVMVPTVVNAVDTPVIGGGGVTDGRSLAALLALGAGAAIMGTRLLTTQECPIHDNLKQALVNATELDTKIVMESIGGTHRVWANEAAHKCAELEAAGGSFEEVLMIVAGEKARIMYEEGDLDCGIVSCGQGVGMADDIPTVKELFDRMMAQATEVVNGLANS